MSTDWKGVKIRYVATLFPYEPASGEMYLDTDTVFDLLDRFPPSEGWQLTIMLPPGEKPEDTP